MRIKLHHLIKKIAGSAYVLVALLTFGHAANAYDRRVTAEYALCRASPKSEYCYRSELAPMAGLFSGLLWPFYWSWELQS